MPPTPTTRGTLPRRAGLGVAAAAVVAAGLLVTRFGHGPVAGAVGDGLYAVLVYLLVALVVPRVRDTVVASIACGLCVSVELAQLTGAPAAVVAAWWPARYVLGTTFQAVSLVAYAVGAAVAGAGDRTSSGLARRS